MLSLEVAESLILKKLGYGDLSEFFKIDQVVPGFRSIPFKYIQL